MAELFDCCSATTTSETFWRMVQSSKDLLSSHTLHLKTPGISPEPSLVTLTILFVGLVCGLLLAHNRYTIQPKSEHSVKATCSARKT